VEEKINGERLARLRSDRRDQPRQRCRSPGPFSRPAVRGRFLARMRDPAGGGRSRRRGQSMLAISCSLRGAVTPGTIVIDKS